MSEDGSMHPVLERVERFLELSCKKPSRVVVPAGSDRRVVSLVVSTMYESQWTDF